MSAFSGTPLAGMGYGGLLPRGVGGQYQYGPTALNNPIIYQQYQQQQAYQQVAQQLTPPLPLNPPKATKYVSEYEWLRRRVNEVLWK